MRALMISAAAALLAFSLEADDPVYSADSVVNTADFLPGPLAANTLATLYGQNLAYGTATLTDSDIRGGLLPTVLPGTGASILIGAWRANLFYVSPTQINFLVPAILVPGPTTLTLVIDAHAGPTIPIQLAAASPALLQLDQQNVLAARADGSLITASAPAQPGDAVILYATGLGDTTPLADYGVTATGPASLKQMADFGVVLDGQPVDPSAIAYAGLMPGFAGLYQINMTLPGSTAANPGIRIGLADLLSPSGLRLAVQP
jgi:uncharacterized protein (TIGR03437 family)